MDREGNTSEENNSTMALYLWIVSLLPAALPSVAASWLSAALSAATILSSSSPSSPSSSSTKDAVDLPRPSRRCHCHRRRLRHHPVWRQGRLLIQRHTGKAGGISSHGGDHIFHGVFRSIIFVTILGIILLSKPAQGKSITQ